MPKIKSNSSAKKRFKVTAAGRVKRNQAHRRHILTKKTTKRKRQLRCPAFVHSADVQLIRRMLPYS